MMEKGSIILMEQPETKVYAGETGYIIIKQVPQYPDDDVVIAIAAENADAVAKAITAAVKEAKEARKEWLEADDDAS